MSEQIDLITYGGWSSGRKATLQRGAYQVAGADADVCGRLAMQRMANDTGVPFVINDSGSDYFPKGHRFAPGEGKGYA